MYKTPAGALKELISNAYDAGATYTKIHTGFPRFDAFSCEDDGVGISKAKFIQLLEGGIGDSDNPQESV
jgi:DNA mismatch repair ATPase MutL